jgi:hypothetical protein
VYTFYTSRATWVGILEELLKYNLSFLVITNCLVISTGTLTKDDLSFIFDSLESTLAACNCLVINTNLSPMMKNSANALYSSLPSRKELYRFPCWSRSRSRIKIRWTLHRKRIGAGAALFSRSWAGAVAASKCYEFATWELQYRWLLLKDEVKGYISIVIGTGSETLCNASYF